MKEISPEPGLKRTLSLPLLVLYGLGVTVGAGIFALVGEVTRLAGDKAPLAFMIAGAIAAITGLSYAAFAAVWPRAAGEAIFVREGLGIVAGRIAGLAMVCTAILSSAVIALAFAGYVGTLIPLPQRLLASGIVVVLGALGCYGVRESVIFAAVVTVIELGTLAIVAIAGLPLLGDPELFVRSFYPPADIVVASGVLSAAVLAFFAFIGFEDIENMGEETLDAKRTLPRAILLTLAVTCIVYLTIALVAVAVPDRQGFVDSPAPLATLFSTVTGLPPAPVSAVAGIAMTNGILVQILMAARVLYGMSRENFIPTWFEAVSARSATPVRATVFVTAAIVALTVTFSLVGLARFTSLVTLGVFLSVNLSLVVVAAKPDAPPVLKRTRLVAMAGVIVCAALIVHQLAGALTVSA